MSTQKLSWWLERRKNTHEKSGKEWALFVTQHDDARQHRWCLWTWKRKPAEKDVEHTILYLQHAMTYAMRVLHPQEPPYLTTVRRDEWDKE